MNAMLSLQLIGTPEVRLGETPLRFQRRRSLALLAYLVLTARAHPRESLAGLLAPDADPLAARHTLRVALAELRQLLGDFLLITRQTIAFAPTQPFQLDLAAVQSALASGDPSALQAALACADGELLAGLCLSQAEEFESWLRLERQRWHDTRAQALQTLLDHYERSGALEAGIAVGRQLLEWAPWCEETHRRLMRLLWRAGQRTAALVQYQRCREMLAGELGLAPRKATTALYERLRAEMPALRSAGLGRAFVPLVGRAVEQARLIELLAEPEARLITVVGLGGMGKSALARAVAAHFLRAESLADSAPFSGGVFLVDLANRPNPRDAGHGSDAGKRQLAMAIAATLGLPQTSADPVARLISALQGRTLLVLDGLDHCLAGLDLMPTLIARAPEVKLVVTSRVRLGIAAETTFELGGLAVPANESELEQCAASQLFLQQAQRVTLGRPLIPVERPHVVRICRLVEGLPLALLLAASWLRTLPCAAIADELELGLDLLTTTGCNLPARQRDMRAVLAWSWQQLGLADQSALRRLAGFGSQFNLEEARAMAGASRRQIQALRDASILSERGSGYYGMHELMRRFAAAEFKCGLQC